jgi:hypothetical protein
MNLFNRHYDMSSRNYYVMLWVLEAKNMKIIASWDVTPCYSCSSTLKMEATRSSETLVTFYQTKRRHIREDSNLDTITSQEPPNNLSR